MRPWSPRNRPWRGEPSPSTPWPADWRGWGPPPGRAFAPPPHHSALARALAVAGCAVLEPLNGRHHPVRTPDGEPASIRYFDGVASLVSHGALLHTHRPDYMELMLGELGGPGGV